MYSESSQSLWQALGATGEGLAVDGPPRTAAAPTPLRALALRLADGRPPIAWSLALLFFFKGLICLATVAFPISATEPTNPIVQIAVRMRGLLAGPCGLGMKLATGRLERNPGTGGRPFG